MHLKADGWIPAWLFQTHTCISNLTFTEGRWTRSPPSLEPTINSKRLNIYSQSVRVKCQMFIWNTKVLPPALTPQSASLNTTTSISELYSYAGDAAIFQLFNHSSILISSFQPNSCVIYLKSNDMVLETLRPACLHCWLILNNLQYNILHVHLQSLCWSPVSPHPGKWTHPFGRVLCVELCMSLYSTHTALTHTYFPLNQCFSSEGSLVQCWTVAYINYREMLNHSQLITYLYIIKNDYIYTLTRKLNI